MPQLRALQQYCNELDKRDTSLEHRLFRPRRPQDRRQLHGISGRIKKLIPHEKLLIMDTGTRIPVEDIVEVTVQTR